MAARVLIVDDETAFADVLAELLVDEGYAVVRAYDGVTALNMLSWSEQSPHIIVCDVIMPGLHGDRLAAEIRRRYPNRYLPIVLMSANADPKVRLTDVRFLPKPVDVRELLKTIEQLVEQPPRGAVAAS